MTPGDKDINLLPADLQKKRNTIRRALVAASSDIEYTKAGNGGDKPTADKGADAADFADNKRKKPDKRKPGILSRIFSIFKKRDKPVKGSFKEEKEASKTIEVKKPVANDLPIGKPLPSALFENKTTTDKEKKSEFIIHATTADRQDSELREAEKKAATDKAADAADRVREEIKERKEERARPLPRLLMDVPDSGVGAKKIQSLHYPDFLNAQPASAPAIKKEKKLGFFRRVFFREKKPAFSPEPIVAPKIPTKNTEPQKSVIQDLQQKKLSLVKEIEKNKPVPPVVESNKKPAPKKPGLLSRLDGIFKRKKLPEAKALPEKEEAAAAKKEEGEKAPAKDSVQGTALEVGQKSKEGVTSAPVRRKELFDVNLLSEEYGRTFKKENPNTLLIGSLVVTALLLGLGYAVIYAYYNSNQNKLEKLVNQNNSISSQAAAYNSLDEEDRFFRDKISAVDALLNLHVSWKLFLSKLEEATIPEVAYVSFAASAEGFINISAVADSYTSVARQITVFSEDTPWIDEVNVTSVAVDTQSSSTSSKNNVIFDIAILINKGALYSQEQINKL